MYRYSWLPLNYRIFGLNHRKYQWNDYVSLACGARVRVWHPASYDNVNIRKNGRPTRVHTWNCLKLVLKNDQPNHRISPQKRVRLDLRSHGAMLHQRSRTKGHHACAIRPLSHGTSVNKQGSFHTREWTRFRAKNYASVRFCRRSRPTTKFLNVCENFARNVGHVKHYCPFTRSSFCNISQECWFFFVVWKGL